MVQVEKHGRKTWHLSFWKQLQVFVRLGIFKDTWTRFSIYYSCLHAATPFFLLSANWRGHSIIIGHKRVHYVLLASLTKFNSRHPHPKQMSFVDPVCLNIRAELHGGPDLCRATWQLLYVALCNVGISIVSLTLLLQSCLPLFSTSHFPYLSNFVYSLKDFSCSFPTHSTCW